MAAWKWPTAAVAVAVAVAVGVARLGSWARGKGKWWLRAGPLPSSERGFGGPGRAGLCLACSLVLFGLGFGHLVRPFFFGRYEAHRHICSEHYFVLFNKFDERDPNSFRSHSYHPQNIHNSRD